MLLRCSTWMHHKHCRLNPCPQPNPSGFPLCHVSYWASCSSEFEFLSLAQRLGNVTSVDFFFFLEQILVLYLCVYLCEYVYLCAGVFAGEERQPSPLELELWSVIKPTDWVLGTALWSSARTGSALSHRATSSAHLLLCFYLICF